MRSETISKAQWPVKTTDPLIASNCSLFTNYLGTLTVNASARDKRQIFNTLPLCGVTLDAD